MLTWFFFTVYMKSLLLYVLVCHCQNPFGCIDSDSTSSLPCWLECLMELGSVWALDLKCEASVHTKSTKSGVSSLLPRSLSPFISASPHSSLTLPPFLSLSFSVVVMSHCSGKKTLIHWFDSTLPNFFSPRKNAQILASSCKAHLFVIPQITVPGLKVMSHIHPGKARYFYCNLKVEHKEYSVCILLTK